VLGIVEEGFEGEVSQRGELRDAVVSAWVDGARDEVVLQAEGGECGDQSGEYLGCSIIGVTFHDGEGAIRGAEEADCRENRSQQARQDGERLSQI